MKSMRQLSKQQIRAVNSKIRGQFGVSFPAEYVYLVNERKRLFVVNKDFKRIDERKLVIDRVGLYVAEIKEREVRLSKEGAQFLGRLADKEGVLLLNKADLSEGQLRAYFRGDNIRMDLGEEHREVLLSYGGEIVGCARYKGGIIYNYQPKQHRGEVIL